MTELSSGNSAEHLTADEQAFLSDGGMEKAARIVLSRSAAKLAITLGLAPEASDQFVDAVRQFDLHDSDSPVESAYEIAAAMTELREVLTRRGSAVLHSVALGEKLGEATSLPAGNIDEHIAAEDREVIVAEKSRETPLAADPEQLDDNEASQPIQLNKRSQKYLQSIFGSLEDLDLREADKPLIADTAVRLRGVSINGHAQTDMAPRILMMFEGMKDAEIARHVDVTGPSVATSFSNMVKRIKGQPGFTYQRAREMLNVKLQRGAEISDDETVDDDETIEQELEGVVAGQSLEFRQTPQTGQLVGAIRRLLRKNGQDHTIALDEPRLKDLIDEVFDKREELPTVREAYITYLIKGVRMPGDSDLSDCIAQMPERIAAVLSIPSNVLFITTATHHPKAANVTPLNMPQRHSVLPFVAPQPRVAHEQKPSVRREVVNGGDVEEVPLLIAAAYREEAMSQEVWYKMAFEQIQAAARSLEMSDEEAEALWSIVHFSGKRKDGEQRSLVAREATKKLEQCMIDRADRLAEYPEVERCMKKFLNNFSPNDLMAIQHTLKKDNPAVYERAAQRYVVAGIGELTRE